MRISDWSSDVCSSDLLAAERCILQRRIIGETVRARGAGDAASRRLGVGVPGRRQREIIAVRRQRIAADRRARGVGGVGRSVIAGLVIGDLEAIRPAVDLRIGIIGEQARSEEHTSELQSLMRISYAVFCLTKKKLKSIYTT